MTRVHVPGAPPTRRERVAALGRAARRRGRTLQAAAARFVARQPDHRLERPIGPLAARVLPLLLRLRFRPEYAVDFDGVDFDAVIQLNLVRDGGRRRDEFEIAIARRRCRVRRRRPGGRRPDATLTGSLADMLRMSAAAVDPLELAGSERFLTSGDGFLLVRFPAMFGQPTRAVT